jgi:hypothetical protein
MHDMISIVLWRNRFRPGRLHYVSGGKTSFECDCLGRSAGVFDRLTGTVRRDPLAWRGNTPTGTYAETFVSHLAKPVLGIGRLWIGLDPVAGQALEAERRGRRGLGIHGGRGHGQLKPTHGCIRLRDGDMAALARVAGKARFTVEIEEV